MGTALPDFEVPHDATDDSGPRRVHLGRVHAYIALSQSQAESAQQ